MSSRGEGLKGREICTENGISDATFYNWRVKYGELTVSELARIKKNEAKISRWRMYADQNLGHHALKDAFEVKL